MPKPGLTQRQHAFVGEYLVDLNQTQAAIRAGYSPKTASVHGARLYANVKVRDAIEAALKRRAERVEVRADDVLRELLRFAMSDIRKAFDDRGRLLPVQDIPEDVARSISSIEVDQLFDGHGAERYQSGDTMKVKFWDKTKGLELLGKHLKLFTDKLEISGRLTLEQLVEASFAKPESK